MIEVKDLREINSFSCQQTVTPLHGTDAERKDDPDISAIAAFHVQRAFVQCLQEVGQHHNREHSLIDEHLQAAILRRADGDGCCGCIFGHLVLYTVFQSIHE